MDPATKLNEAIEEMVEEVVGNYDFDDAISEAVKDYDFDDAISEAVSDYDLSKEVEEVFSSHINDLDISEKVEEEIESVLEKKLPEMVKNTFLELLKDKDFLEKLSSALFDKAD